MPYLIQILREYTSKVDKLEEAESQRVEETAHQENKPMMIREFHFFLIIIFFMWLIWSGYYCFFLFYFSRTSVNVNSRTRYDGSRLRSRLSIHSVFPKSRNVLPGLRHVTIYY